MNKKLLNILMIIGVVIGLTLALYGILLLNGLAQ